MYVTMMASAIASRRVRSRRVEGRILCRVLSFRFVKNNALDHRLMDIIATSREWNRFVDLRAPIPRLLFGSERSLLTTTTTTNRTDHAWIGPIFKVTSLPVLIATLVASGEDFRREIFFSYERVSAASGSSFYPFKSGLIVTSYDEVSMDMRDPHQQRGPYFGLSTVGTGGDIPEACMPSDLTLFKSSGTDAHTTFRSVLKEAVHALTVDDPRPGKIPIRFPPRSKKDVLEWIRTENDDALETFVLRVVGVNVLSRIFKLSAATWPERVAEIVEEYQAIGPVCAVGIPGFAGKAPTVQALMDELREYLIEHSRGVVKKIVELGDDAFPDVSNGGDATLRQIIFGSMFAGLGGTYHLTSHAIRRIRSDPETYVPMFRRRPKAFLVEQARLDPPVTSYSSLSRSGATVKVWPLGMFGAMKGTPQQMCIATANRDVDIFGGPDRDRAYADSFDPSRENLNQVLSWNGVEIDVTNGVAPRGCPGHDLSQHIAEGVIRAVLSAMDEVEEERLDAAEDAEMRATQTNGGEL